MPSRWPKHPWSARVEARAHRGLTDTPASTVRPLRPAARALPGILLMLVALAAVRVPAQDVRVNELMTSNGTLPADENGDYPDWFELVNPTDGPLNLSGWGVTDDPSRPFKWTFGETVIGPGDYLLVFASGKDRQPGATAPVPPESLSGLRLWLRADAVNTNDPVQVRRAGNSVFVRRWRDQSGAGAHADQAADTSQPLWVASGLYGRPTLRFDGDNDQLRLPQPSATNSFCLLAVFRTSRAHEVDPEGASGAGGVSGQRYLFGAQHGGDDDGGSGLSVGTNGVSVYEHGSGYMPALAVYTGALGTGGVIVAVNYDARRLSLDVQGLAIRADLASPRAQVTSPVEIGRGAYGAFGGDLAEVLLYDRPLTEPERRGVAAHLAARYGIATPQPRHTNFQLSSSGEDLQLTRPDGSVADHVAFGPVARNVSYGRQPDGAGPFVFFAEPTPGAANHTPGATELLAAPLFSHPGGFYTNAFDLELTVTNRNAAIHYTLDGSEPTDTSPLYRTPLRIRSRVGTANTISMIPTVPGGTPPSGEVYKGWVVRARAFQPDALPSEIVTGFFWVEARGRGRYTLPIVSLATDPANLFDNTRGIYVPGNAPNGNYSQRGPEWERPAHVALFEIDGHLAFSQEAGVKIHGNTSQGFPIKGLDLDGTSGRGRQPFKHRIFPDRARREFEHFLLRPTGHDQLMAFMRDELMQSLAAETGAESQAARACVVFINGEYWGLHYLKEKEDAEFVAYYADRAMDEIDYLEGYASAKAGDVTHYQALIDYIAAQDLRQAASYAVVGARMELPSYIDYKVCEIFFYRWDIGNHRLWRPRVPEGRWRWLQFDNDVGWGGFWAEQPAWQFDMLTADLTPSGSLHGHNGEATTFLLRRLVENAEFRRDFVNRFQDLLNTLFTTDYTIARIDQMAAVLAPEMAEHTRRWRSPASLSAWQSHVDYLRTYATNRPQFAREHLRQRFGLEPPSRLSLSVNATQRGTVRLNSLDLAAPTNAPWVGLYARRHPITVRAVPRPGYQFAGWDGLPGVSTNAVTLLLNGDLALTARFEADPASQPRVTLVRRDAQGLVRWDVLGTPNAPLLVETSDDLVQWRSRAILDLDEVGAAEFGEAMGPGPARRFYRLRLP